MFKVKHRGDNDQPYTVYAVEKNSTGTVFLIWYAGRWRWESADNYIPALDEDAIPGLENKEVPSRNAN